MDRLAYKLILSIVGLALSFTFSACTASGDAEEISPVMPDSASGGSSGKSGDDPVSSSSEAKKESNAEIDSAIARMGWSDIPASKLTKGGVSFTVDEFKMSTVEVTQGLYGTLMGEMPTQGHTGDKYPIENVNWYQAALFCNKLSKWSGFDTAYIYKSVGKSDALDDLEIDYSVESIRLPTEMEWEIASRGGTTTTYYWGTDPASDYAYYGQSSGPSEVAQFEPNAYGLYDMAGNVAEWVNDWYGAYPAESVINYGGPDKGDYRVIRGGGWSNVIKDCAPDVRDKKEPSYKSARVGFRVVHSAGF